MATKKKNISFELKFFKKRLGYFFVLPRVGRGISSIVWLQTLRQFSQDNERLWDFLVNNEQRWIWRVGQDSWQIFQTVSHGSFVCGHISQKEWIRSSSGSAPKDDFGMISDEIDLDGSIVQFHDHSSLISRPTNNLRYDRSVAGADSHLIGTEWRHDTFGQIFIHVPNEIVQELQFGAEIDERRRWRRGFPRNRFACKAKIELFTFHHHFWKVFFFT